ncbi:MAG: acetate/propionate family kinase [Deltaproteobacteria bacterium]|nr:acetate/propionate family kinase [Deltaproteobacteria bacterium]
MNTTDICTLLKNNVPLFSDFSMAALTDIVAASTLASAEENEAIIEFGSRRQALGVLLKGRVLVSTVQNTGDTREIAEIDAPGLFGEMSLMTGERALADVIGMTRCEIMWIPEPVFNTQVITNPAALQHLGKLLTRRASALAFDVTSHGAQRQAETGSDDPFGLVLRSDTPHKILVINCGSSSLKFQLFDTERQAVHVVGQVECIGQGTSTLHFRQGDTRQQLSCECPDHQAAFEQLVGVLRQANVIADAMDISAVGHRVVHGGERFTEATVIDDDVIGAIDALTPLAPLHNPVNLTGIRAARQAFPGALHVAVFDTTFHHTLPPYAYLYGLPMWMYREMGVRRYGFHGTSHAYVSLKAAQLLKRPYNELETVVCHLGSGASVCAVDHGRSVDTSMGMTPTAGLPMGTRSGDVDPGALCYVARKSSLDIDGLDKMLNRDSGLLGLSGQSNDMRELEQLADAGDSGAQLAIKTFCYSVRKYIGAYVAAMEGIDALVFTGGIGENSALVRTLACQGLACMGIAIDPHKNQNACGVKESVDISASSSRVRVLVIPTDEERMIARQTLGAIDRYQAAIDRTGEMQIPIEVSAHHVHLSPEHVALLFGDGHTLTPVADLSQPGQYACAEQVNLIGPKGTVTRVRVLGPERKQTQVEISMTEQFKLGIHPPIRESGDLKDTPGLTLEGPAGKVELSFGVICAMRHIHMSPKDALRFGVRDRYVVRVVVDGDRELIFGDVLVRVSPNYALAMHLDTDEANAAHLSTGATGRIDSIQSKSLAGI